MTGICWEFDTFQDCKAYIDDREFVEEAVVQIDLDLSFEKVSNDNIPEILWTALCDSDIGPWEPVRFEYEIISKEPSKPVKVICSNGNCKIVHD